MAATWRSGTEAAQRAPGRTRASIGKRCPSYGADGQVGRELAPRSEAGRGEARPGEMRSGETRRTAYRPVIVVPSSITRAKCSLSR
eukprot:scaffold157_cov24-Tisochrysis_lutea.AAC.5